MCAWVYVCMFLCLGEGTGLIFFLMFMLREEHFQMGFNFLNKITQLPVESVSSFWCFKLENICIPSF